MKKHFFLFILSLSITGLCFAQEEQTQNPVTPKWLSDKGYWVIENNVHAPKSNVIYFYTTDNVLVYKERVDGVKIKVNKTKVCMKLKAALEQAVTVWEATHKSNENKAIIAVALKK